MKKGYFYAKKKVLIHFNYKEQLYDIIVRPIESKIIEKFDGETYEITDEATKEAFFFKKKLNGKYLELDDDLVDYALEQFKSSDDPLMWKDME